MAGLDERFSAHLQRLEGLGWHWHLGVTHDVRDARDATTQALGPPCGVGRLHRVELVQHHHEGLLQCPCHMVDQGRRQVEQGMSRVGHEHGYLTTLQHPPELAPDLEVLFKGRRVPAPLGHELLQVSKPLLEGSCLAMVEPAAAELEGPDGSSRHEAPHSSGDVEVIDAEFLGHGGFVVQDCTNRHRGVADAMLDVDGRFHREHGLATGLCGRLLRRIVQPHFLGIELRPRSSGLEF
mmetsp:Transcript_71943/g.153793  ORF Transcript_71943/g.153793 Transcript_71943/m.153793 type:complete len:237 (-) Transcript_71943:209-919(-)